MRPVNHVFINKDWLCELKFPAMASLSEHSPLPRECMPPRDPPTLLGETSAGALRDLIKETVRPFQFNFTFFGSGGSIFYKSQKKN